MDAAALRLSLAHGAGDPEWFYKQPREVQARVLGLSMFHARRRPRAAASSPTTRSRSGSAVAEFWSRDADGFRWAGPPNEAAGLRLVLGGKGR